jgi:CMP-N,N'-diacetyllegionaminic acid synthase
LNLRNDYVSEGHSPQSLGEGVMQVVAVITARGGSKSVPRKNIAVVGGKPLLAWTLEAALQANKLSRIILSTDDSEIAAVGREWGAEVPFMRPEELSGDLSPSIPVLWHAIDWLESNQGTVPSHVLLLQPTSPLRTGEDIDNAMALLQEKHADSVVSVSESKSHPYLAKVLGPDGRLSDFNKPSEGYLARQTLPSSYHLNGAIYLARREVIRRRGTFFTDSTYGYVMPQERSLDVDTPWDLFMADLILTQLREKAVNRREDHEERP